MNIASVDLNLLVPLSALLDDRHVSRAAVRCNLTQSAMSRALRRLRDAFDDELMVRGSAGYVLTPRGERLQRELLVVLPQLQAMFAPACFEPASAAETFRLAGTDYPALLFGSALFRHVLLASPRSTVIFTGWHDAVLDDLERGSVDLAFYGGTPPASTRAERLFDERFVCVMSADHPLAGRTGPLPLDSYLRCSHVVVDIGGCSQPAIETSLSAVGESRTGNLRVPYHAAAMQAVPGTELVATLPERLVANQTVLGTRVIPAPAEIEHMTYSMVWHPRLDRDLAQRWLRDAARRVTHRLDAGPMP